ncbi:ABC transporter ATP-binding protein [Occultella glacieicola]|uniref:ABC transporter ATP-binding protein n=1 Tax=Occultella glacieicola TaxID=2518684 RepID=A0ABY2E5Q8_9MICO|nr:ABC transporter ATP-binding protein [Occultella glacieicola]TDE94840.1 ABC transporter ATP-binding protein [Occultella glacieicola]
MTRTSGSAVDVRGLRVVRGSTTALDGVDVRVAEGAITGLLGPSGSGKTTLIRSILGVQVTAAGSVTVLGHPAGSGALRREVGYVTQAPSVYPDLTVAENLRYFARVLGVPDVRADVERVLDVVDLHEQRRQLTATLSGGQASRVNLAAALLGTPHLVVLDEPTVGLDPVLRDSLWGTFSEIAATGTAVLVSSHVMDEAVRCDHLILLRAGRVLARGTPAELLIRTGTDSAEQAFLALVRQGHDTGGRDGPRPDRDGPAS